MGSGITREKSREFNMKSNHARKVLRHKFEQVDEIKCVLVGPSQSGKTQLFRNLINKSFVESYEANESAQLGFKIFNTVKSDYENLYPVSLHVTDTPGSLMRTGIASEFFFKDCHVVLILVDITMNLEPTRVETWTQYVLK